ncbi:hypothetical protein [Aurantiacibacter rhizosphaerae]|uniref:DUF4345 domain-containing protein n=1 Tax=Aurantiacibacter rhizosphaerae TaxID=2691582 RepID=A0A844XGJ8_9SPHN|nr:hypothetical protein [Aurantiacibacter rhizosphaerae]MWV28859.1 hypothetical protein [Aurantiacibacter rhizosphaerae]
MTFHIMAWVMTVAGSLLGLRFIFGGAGMLREWGIEVSDGAVILFRRLGVVYLALGLVFFLARDAAPSDFRSAVCLVMAGAIAILGFLGLFEYLARRAGRGILIAAVGEWVLAALFIWVWWGGQ